MVNPSCPKTSADPMLGIHNGACGYACLIIAVTACHTAISMICHRKNVKPCKMWSWIENELIELINSNQFRLSIPIQFQFKIFQFNSNSIHAELNWIDYQFQFNSWIDPSPVIWHHRSCSTLVQIMPCCLFSTKPLHEPMLTHCQLNWILGKQTSVKL